MKTKIKVLVIHGDENARKKIITKLESEKNIETTGCTRKDSLKILQADNFKYILIGSKDNKFIKHIKKNFVGTLIALRDSNIIDGEAIKAGCRTQIKREDVSYLLPAIIETDSYKIVLAIRAEGEKDHVLDFKKLVIEFADLYQKRGIDSLETAEKLLDDIQVQIKKIDNIKIEKQIKKIKAILNDLKFCEDSVKDIYAENLQAEIKNLYSLAISLSL
jgi:hypothetical protein